MPRSDPWTPEAISKLGYVADSVIADMIGVTRAAIAAKRERLGIPACDAPTGPKPRGEAGAALKIRLTVEERGLVEAAAGVDGKPPSTWARDAIVREAGRLAAIRQR